MLLPRPAAHAKGNTVGNPNAGVWGSLYVGGYRPVQLRDRTPEDIALEIRDLCENICGKGTVTNVTTKGTYCFIVFAEGNMASKAAAVLDASEFRGFVLRAKVQTESNYREAREVQVRQAELRRQARMARATAKKHATVGPHGLVPSASPSPVVAVPTTAVLPAYVPVQIPTVGPYRPTPAPADPLSYGCHRACTVPPAAPPARVPEHSAAIHVQPSQCPHVPFASQVTTSAALLAVPVSSQPLPRARKVDELVCPIPAVRWFSHTHKPGQTQPPPQAVLCVPAELVSPAPPPAVRFQEPFAAVPLVPQCCSSTQRTPQESGPALSDPPAPVLSPMASLAPPTEATSSEPAPQPQGDFPEHNGQPIANGSCMGSNYYVHQPYADDSAFQISSYRT